jgi:hypothetical protein
VEFGFRNLALIQQLRRKPIDANFAYQAGNLRFFDRIHSMRRREPITPVLQGKLDEIAQRLAIGRLAAARAKLARVEACSR